MHQFPDYLRFDPPVIGHRGACGNAPENTMPGFEQAAAEGAVWIETDVKLTQEGIPILFHDDTLQRTTDGTGDVAASDWPDLQKLDAGTWFDAKFAATPIPLLTDLLKLARTRHLRLNLELKPCPGRARVTTMVTLMEIAKFWLEDDAPVLLSSFDIEALLVAKQLHPEWPRGLLLEDWVDNWAELARQTGASTIHPNARDLTKPRVEQLGESGLPILTYVVNDVARAKELLQWGVSAVFSDCPGEIIRAL